MICISRDLETASIRDLTPSFARMLETCAFAVLSVITSVWATKRLLAPFSNNDNTCISRGVKLSGFPGMSTAWGVEAIAYKPSTFDKISGRKSRSKASL